MNRDSYFLSGEVTFDDYYKGILIYSKYSLKKRIGFIGLQFICFLVGLDYLIYHEEVDFMFYLFFFGTFFLGFYLLFGLGVTTPIIKPIFKKRWTNKYSQENIIINISICNDGTLSIAGPANTPVVFKACNVNIIIENERILVIKLSNSILVIPNLLDDNIKNLLKSQYQFTNWIKV